MSEWTKDSLDNFYRSSEVYRTFNTPFVLDTIGVIESIIRGAVKTSLVRLDKLLTWQDGWDGYDASAPDPDAVAYAKQWICQMFIAATDVARTWIDPNLTGGSEGEVVFEWWSGKKKLTIYVTADSVEYVRVWGLNIDTEMADGSAVPFGTCQALWLWLTAE
ncbi:MAG: hypothetical protein ACRDHP_15015 [Ktedonobacterales bacterium]